MGWILDKVKGVFTNTPQELDIKEEIDFKAVMKQLEKDLKILPRRGVAATAGQRLNKLMHNLWDAHEMKRRAATTQDKRTQIARVKRVLARIKGALKVLEESGGQGKRFKKAAEKTIKAVMNEEIILKKESEELVAAN